MSFATSAFRCVHDAELGDSVAWLEAPDFPDAESVRGAIQLEYDEVAETATLRSPIFVGVDRGHLVGAALMFDAQLGYLLGIDFFGDEPGRYNRVIDPLYTARHVHYRGRDVDTEGDDVREESGQSETLLAPLSPSLLMRYRDVGLTLRTEGRGTDVVIGLPAHLIEGFLRRIEAHLPMPAVTG